MTVRPCRTLATILLLAVAVATSAAPAAVLAKPKVDGFSETAKLTASDGAAGAVFGYCVAAGDGVAVVGAYRDAEHGTDAGAAYVYEGTAWSETAKLVPADVAAGDRVGDSVAVSGDTIVVGSPRDDDMGTDAGAAYVFVRDGASWVEQAKLLATDGSGYQHLGHEVAVSGDTAAVSAGSSVYVFARDGDAWVQQQKLTSPSGVYDYFGSSVAIDGDTAIVGAYGWDSIYDEGRAYVFTRSSDVWSHQATLAASDGLADDMFGFSVDVSGDTAIVGAWGDDDNGSSSGSAYVFARSGDTWSESARLQATGGNDWDYFGYFVSIDGATAVVGAHGDDEAAPDAGAAYVFSGDAGWSEGAKLLGSDLEEGDLSGNASIHGGTVLVGAIGDDDAGADAGAAYVFEKSEWTPPGKGGTPPGQATKAASAS
jgi:hypothetical protein